MNDTQKGQQAQNQSNPQSGANQDQARNQQGSKEQYTSQSGGQSTDKVGNNIEKDEPTAQNRSGGMKDEASTNNASGSSSPRKSDM